MCVSLPIPVTAQEISSGCDFVLAMSSGSVPMRSAGLTTMNIGFSPAA